MQNIETVQCPYQRVPVSLSSATGTATTVARPRRRPTAPPAPGPTPAALVCRPNRALKPIVFARQPGWLHLVPPAPRMKLTLVAVEVSRESGAKPSHTDIVSTTSHAALTSPSAAVSLATVAASVSGRYTGQYTEFRDRPRK